ncbi:hypothetical protein GCM10022220_00340 [Actinocatenispora rupis]|uniref:Cytosine-specific methyltransferase n=2 Tax=Actinocatenispora rupis TaxID=519421 RepID=A0A8J3NFR7_9ACTN|nr:hypothetical protein Aru02nite_49880 [Actinocatenispora rupis]
MSYGFHAHPGFSLVGAADVEVGKPSTGHGAIGCNATYAANIGIKPLGVDLSAITPAELSDAILPGQSEIDVLLACPPCTGFSRAISRNYVEDDPRNSLVATVADFAAALKPKLIMMENVPQLINGNFRHHFIAFKEKLEELGYSVAARAYRLDNFGLPQQRERAIIIAAKQRSMLRTLDDLWAGYRIAPGATTVRRAISGLPAIEAGGTAPNDPNHTCPALSGDSLMRITAMPHDGGSWPDLLGDATTEKYLIPSMWKAVSRGRLNAYCDVYGRMSWDRPAPTVKRECSHVGNGRYAHPEQDRQCTVRELAILQGFPADYRFVGNSRKNLYRQVGDAVPPLVSYQLAHVANWVLTGTRPNIEHVLLPKTHLTASDLEAYDSDPTQLALV